MSKERYLQPSCPSMDCEVRKEHKDLQTKYEKIKREKDDLQLSHEEIIGGLRQENEDDDAKTKQISRLVVENSDKAKEVSDLKEKLGELRLDHETLNRNYNNQSQELNDVRGRYLEFKSETEINEDIKSARLELSSINQHIIKNNEKFNLLQKDLEIKESKLREVKDYHDSLVGSITEKNRSLNELTSLHDDYRKDLKSINKLHRKHFKHKHKKGKKKFWFPWWLKIMLIIIIFGGGYLIYTMI